jgi:hypothetical protein
VFFTFFTVASEVEVVGRRREVPMTSFRRWLPVRLRRWSPEGGRRRG